VQQWNVSVAVKNQHVFASYNELSGEGSEFEDKLCYLGSFREVSTTLKSKVFRKRPNPRVQIFPVCFVKSKTKLKIGAVVKI
jgi:hypothetical protein